MNDSQFASDRSYDVREPAAVTHDKGRAQQTPIPPQPPAQTVSDTLPTNTSDIDRQRPTEKENLTDTVGQVSDVADKAVGHDVDLPPKDDRHTLSTYEAGKIFEEAQCRVSERTIIRWCNKNKQGVRRLDCAFDASDRKYYIAEESVKAVIRDERRRGRQSDILEADLSDIEQASDTVVGHEDQDGGQRPTESDTRVGQAERMSDDDRQSASHQGPETSEPPAQAGTVVKELTEENTRLKIELAKLEEQRNTKDEMMSFLRREIDRRGEVIQQDQETYKNSLIWYQAQIEGKDRVIERLNTEMRGLLEAPKPARHHDPPADTIGHAHNDGPSTNEVPHPERHPSDGQGTGRMSGAGTSDYQ